MTISDFGVFYVAAGQKYVDEACKSATSLKKINPSLKISLLSDRELPEQDLFEKVILVEEKVTCRNEGLLFKVKHLYFSSPYQKTLFVDTDTYFTDDCASGFDILNYFDLALVPAPVDTHYPQLDSGKKIECKPLNTGVILYNKNENNDSLFSCWLDTYTKKLTVNSKLKQSDQTSFVEALMQSKSRVYPLPPEWNARFCFINAFCEPVKILHGYSSNIEKIAQAINSAPKSSRVWIPHLKKCIVFKPYTWRHTLGKIKFLRQLLGK
ncbi:Glycosyl transferase family 8 (modular protein) [Hyella patelloides LEGE 07179]|uniref:Glycosyl transferase family 8 (Modular protein) n=1 Tax=Hyella patelloides LEGE 07179 TaxID=945734 RepID=A0A563VJU0_9CYAN|nr:hypothetical protein [Hyella patelloides]VEP11597.1 Glycosyl transferase family 8 (modular protein) [Hyella patelloides LEGE 07179]